MAMAMVDTPWGRAEPIATPIIASGLSAVVADAFRPLLEARGYGALMAGGGASSSSPAAAKPVRFYASGPIAGLLVDGDLSMSGIGTVTWVKGDRFLAFGHPFLGIGKTEMPVSNANIVVTVASDVGSWKMGEATAPVGRLTDDRLHAIAGTMNEFPKTVPVTLTFDLPSPRKGADAQTTDHFSVVKHPTDTPLFSAISVANALQNRIAVDAGGTYDVVVDATLSTGDRLVLPGRVADKNADVSLPAAFAVLSALSSATDSDFADVTIEAVNVSVKGRSTVENARVVAARIVKGGVAGEEVVVAARLQPMQGTGKAFDQSFTFKLPRGLAAGSYSVVVASAGGASRIERESGIASNPQSFADELNALRASPPPGSLSVYLVQDDASARLEGRPLPNLPNSLAEVTSGTGGVFGGGSYELRAERMVRTTSTGVISGEATARLVVTVPDAG